MTRPLAARGRVARITLPVVACLALQAAAAGAAPNLRVDAVDASAVQMDCQTAGAMGTVVARISNRGPDAAATAFAVHFFEDTDGDRAYTAGVDALLGSETVAGGLDVGATAAVATTIDATLLFAGGLIYAVVDGDGAIAESDESDNLSHSGLACEFIPPPGAFDPVVQWAWNSSDVLPDHLNVMMTPGIMDITGDGVPEVVFGSTDSTRGSLVVVGVLRALDGETGAELFTVTDPDLAINTASSVALGDIDLDGAPEIVACDSSGTRLIAFEHDGAFKWRSPELETINWGAPAIADLDADAIPEIVIGRQVLNADGSLRWTGSAGHGGQDGGGPRFGPVSLVADIDLDGSPEIVAGNSAYSAAGELLWQSPQPDGYNGVANFDADEFPEIVLVSQSAVWLLEHDGSLKWGPVAIPGGGFGGPPTIADYDLDGEPEIGVAGAARYFVLETDGTLKWETTTQDMSSNRTGSSVFDFDNDGAAEVVYRDELYLRILRGSDGFVLLQTPMSSATWHEYVQVADVDADGNAEIVAVANNSNDFGPQRGVFVLRDSMDRWVSTRRVWNQHTYHVTNVEENGTIPPFEQPSWLGFNDYRKNNEAPGSPFAAPDLTASLVAVDDSLCPDTASVVARIGNGGANVAVAPVDVAFYDGDPAGGSLLGVAQTTTRLEPGDWEDVSLSLTPPAPGVQRICVAADDQGLGLGVFNECDETNNVCCADVAGLCCPAGDPDPRTQGFWKRQCRGPHPSGEHDRLPDYVACVSRSLTFADAADQGAICSELHTRDRRNKCEKAEAQFMALLLNTCSGRTAECKCVSDPVLGQSTVAEAIAAIDALLANPGRTFRDCVQAEAIADAINNGQSVASCS